MATIFTLLFRLDTRTCASPMLIPGLVLIDPHCDMQVEDLEQFFKLMQEQHPGLAAASSWFLGGYSFGAQVAAHAAVVHTADLAGLILVSAAAGVHRNSIKARCERLAA